MRQTQRHRWLIWIIWIICLAGCTAETTPSPPAPPRQEISGVADLEIVKGQTIYVPAYSDIYFAPGKTLDMAITLSIHNTDVAHPIIVTSVRYYSTQGQLVKEYVTQPRQLAPLEAADFFVDQYDESGGVGANFIVEWVAEEPVYEPVVEAVMIGAISSLSFSFISPGRVMTQTALSIVQP